MIPDARVATLQGARQTVGQGNYCMPFRDALSRLGCNESATLRYSNHVFFIRLWDRRHYSIGYVKRGCVRLHAYTRPITQPTRWNLQNILVGTPAHSISTHHVSHQLCMKQATQFACINSYFARGQRDDGGEEESRGESSGDGINMYCNWPTAHRRHCVYS